ncbi:MAG: hypothetical protein V4485_06450 [Pseudomonadota bacterium]
MIKTIDQSERQKVNIPPRYGKLSLQWDHQVSTPMECYRLVGEFFKKDKEKTKLWFESKNPLLGNISPEDMLSIGRGWKLLKFIQNQMEGNSP